MPGSIIDENATTYTIDDGTGNTAVVPKGSIDPSAYNYAAPVPASFGAPPPSAPPPPQMGGALDAPMPSTPRPAPPMPTFAPLQPAPPPPTQPAAPGKPMPPQRQPTPAEIQDQGTREAIGGIQDQRQAVADAGAAEAAQATQEAKVLRERNAAIDAQQKQFEAQRAQEAELAQKYQAEAHAAANAEENFKVDPNKLYADMGTGKKIGVYIMAALSGIGDALQHKGGPNPVLGMLDSAIAQDVNMQLDQRNQLGKKAQRLGAEADKFVAGGANREAARSMKMAVLTENAARQVEAIAAAYKNPAMLARAAKVAGELRAQAGQYIENAGKNKYQQDLQERTFREQQRAARAQEGIANANLALRRDEIKYNREQDQKKLELEAAKLLQQGNAAGAEALQKYGVPGVIDPKTGQTAILQSASPEEATKIRDKVAATREAVDILDKIREIRTGGTTATGNSAEFQKLKTLQGQLQVTLKNAYQLGALSESDFELLNKGAGFDDPTKWRTIAAGVDQARENLVTSARTALAARGIDGFDIKDQTKAAETPSDIQVKTLLGKTDATERDIEQARAMGKSLWSGQGTHDYYAAHYGMNADQADAFRALQEAAASPDPKVSGPALSSLNVLAREADNDNIRAHASRELARAAQRSMNSGAKTTDF